MMTDRASWELLSSQDLTTVFITHNCIYFTTTDVHVHRFRLGCKGGRHIRESSLLDSYPVRDIDPTLLIHLLTGFFRFLIHSCSFRSGLQIAQAPRLDRSVHSLELRGKDGVDGDPCGYIHHLFVRLVRVSERVWGGGGPQSDWVNQARRPLTVYFGGLLDDDGVINVPILQMINRTNRL